MTNDRDALPDWVVHEDRQGEVPFGAPPLDSAAFTEAVAAIDSEPMRQPFTAPRYAYPRIDRVEQRVMLTAPAVADLLRRVEQLEAKIAEMER